MNKLVKRSFLNALATAVYIAAIATLLFNGNKIFGQKDTPLTPILALLLFVLSAAITGSLVVGKPVLMYLNNQKSEAIKLFVYTLGWLALVTIIVLVANIHK